jgi:glutathione S-transferase
MLELYHSGLTTCSKQVRHCLREKGLPYRSRYVELWRYENLSPDYLKLNPNGVVPTLVHDGTPIINSFCINEYIEDVFPAPALRPADPRERARMRYWAWTADEIHLALARLTHSRMLQARVEGLSEAEQAIMLAHTPVPEKRERWRLLTKGGYSAEQLQAALDNVIFVFGRMESELAERGPWLAGATYSLGDISMLAIVHRISELYADRLDRAAFPRLIDWWDRSMTRPAAAYVYADGGEETPSRPPTKSIAGITEYRIQESMVREAQ